jgi:hypothetical protein
MLVEIIVCFVGVLIVMVGFFMEVKLNTQNRELKKMREELKSIRETGEKNDTGQAVLFESLQDLVSALQSVRLR